VIHRALLAALLGTLPVLPASALAACRVLDEEIAQHYEGGCRDGLAHGKGVAVGFARYEGQFRRGRKHGQGVKTWPWGDRYTGDFVDDRKEGVGTYEWGEGSRWGGERYVGGFMADRREGEGIYTWPNGDRFEGRWKEDQRLGLSAMEMRRGLAQQAWQRAFLPGVTVCRVGGASVPDSVEAGSKGAVVAFDGTALQVQLAAGPTALDPASAGVVSDEPVNWSPCF
jgi:hypothetical protein